MSDQITTEQLKSAHVFTIAIHIFLACIILFCSHTGNKKGVDITAFIFLLISLLASYPIIFTSYKCKKVA